MARGLAIIGQDNFSLGMFKDVAPHLIPERGAQDIRNGLLEDEGSIYRRGGTVNKSGAAFGASGLRFLFDGYFDAGRRTLFANPSDFGVLDSDDSTVVNLGSDGLSFPVPARVIESIAWIGGGYAYAGSRKAASYSTGTVTATNGSKVVTGSGTSWSTNLDAGMLFQAGSERLYVIASVDSNTQITLRDAYEGTTGAGKTYTAHNIYKVTGPDPYEIADHYVAVANRLVSASGDIVKFTTLTDGVFTHSIATNDFHRILGGARVTGLAALAQTAIVFTTHGVWTLDGLAYDIVDADGNFQHALRQVSDELVLTAASGIAGWGQMLVVPCVDGIYLFDGVSTPVRISSPIEGYYRDYIEGGARPGQAVVFRGHYLLPILDAAGACIDLLVCHLDHPTANFYPWTRLADAGGEITAFAVRRSETTRDPLLLGAEARATSRVVNCTGYFAPSADNKNDADGSTHEFQVTTRDYATGNNTLNRVRHIRTRYELVDAGADNPYLAVSYGTGATDPDAPEWGGGAWNGAEWADPGDIGFTALEDCTLPEDPAGTTVPRCRVGRRTRHIRYRVNCDMPAERLVLRSVESFIAPSKALRR